MNKDIITAIFTRVFNEVKQEFLETTRMGILLALTVAFVATVIIPWWVTLPVLVAGWIVIIKDHYDNVMVWEAHYASEEEKKNEETTKPE